MFRTAVRIAILLLPLLWQPAHAATAISSTRVWPAQDYTRLTIESKHAIRHNLFTLSEPERLVIDLENVELGKPLNELAQKFGDNDPYIKSARVARFKPGVVRLVLDLKTAVKPQLFSLKPVGEYGHRLVLDVYPAAEPVDPLMALLEQTPGDSTPIPAPAAITEQSIQPAGTPEAPTVPELRTRTIVVAIDAGHGGEDPGARGRRGTLEKNITLAVARKVKALIDGTPGMRGELIRDGDYFIPLGLRVAKARKVKADLFVSIHADAFQKTSARGSSVFALSERGATSSAARWLAKKENEADLIGGVNLAVKDPYLARTLLDLSQTATISDSLKVAKYVLNELGDINTLHRGEVEQAGFAVLKSPEIPSILVETAFISNPKEEHRLNDGNFQSKLADAIVSGIKRYFSQNPALSRHHVARAEQY